MQFIICGKMKLKIGIATCLLTFCLVQLLLLLLQSSNIFNLHKSVFTATRPNDYEEPMDKLLGGLLSTDLDEDSCLSRYQSSLYRKPSSYKPSEYLISKLRRYEMLHKRFGLATEAYKRATENLVHNHVLSMVSVFLYALLTERIILVDQWSDTSDLFCEHFPGTSWLLPLDSPLMDQPDSFNREHSHCYGTMLKNHGINSTTISSQLYLYLFHDYGDHDQTFFCEDNQMIIGKVRWLVVKSNQYFVPSLWLIPSFQTKLIKLFPQKDTVFHHLSRYLLHPRNQVWGIVTRSYIAYLSRADERLGIQVRLFEEGTGPLIKHVMDQTVACTQRDKLLPEVDTLSSKYIQKS
ncbi:unnamed protein product [Eruca vesicaria subsp. sativa]|uniref:Fucosyltransferase n=1 Tax=Eruca vesicaria subsp. sativa TaxID=29727 RepID=A0ABC8LFS2_ERUVS|nr:unnamed protein product [Eruca vesicaria subsp. sativa]